MNDDKAKAAYYNPPRKLDAETLALTLRDAADDAADSDGNYGWAELAEAFLQQPNVLAHNAAVWQEGCHWGADSLGGRLSLDNPYREQP